MMLFHRTCKLRTRIARRLRLRPRGEVSRFILKAQDEVDVMLSTRTYECQSCRTVIHVDMDWSEGATPEPKAVID